MAEAQPWWNVVCDWALSARLLLLPAHPSQQTSPGPQGSRGFPQVHHLWPPYKTLVSSCAVNLPPLEAFCFLALAPAEPSGDAVPALAGPQHPLCVPHNPSEAYHRLFLPGGHFLCVS